MPRISTAPSAGIGPERLLIIASVGIVGDHTQAELATILREIERRLLKHKYIGLAVLTLATFDDVDIVA
jgi:hypothetical protein